ncbi:hypothetical protein HZH66_003829 [Vespula vulgaris]|uniref:Uncharacterized protein n=1 Tax=Vespula vulgaris TaxID=7454 RepID=A0A834KDT7_VESVU|nr:hypothetical protein HZH66_003829 [Vespula vulgaris]
MHELGKREHVLRNILLQHSRAESNRRSLDTSSVCGNRTLPDEICFGVRGGQQNELPVSRPDNLGCAVARMELSIKADGVPLEHPLIREIDEVPLLWANDLTKSRICGLENELSAGASSN